MHKSAMPLAIAMLTSCMSRTGAPECRVVVLREPWNVVILGAGFAGEPEIHTHQLGKSKA
jgi:hypothetical protein